MRRPLIVTYDCHGTPRRPRGKRSERKKSVAGSKRARDRAAREAREELEKCSAERDEECIYADLARRLDLRERYWTAFETWVRCQRVVEQMKCDKKLRLAVGSRRPDQGRRGHHADRRVSRSEAGSFSFIYDGAQ